MTYEAVVLAAGRSSRAGTFKPALDCGGVPLIRRVVRAFAQVCQRTWVVTGYQAEQVEALVAGEPGVETVYHPGWELGMFSSVRAGAARVTADRFFVTPGDLPLIDAALVQALADTPGSVVVPVWGHEGGHPVLLDAAWAASIVTADPGSNLRAVLAGTPKVRVPAPDDGVLRDIDTCEDYEEMRLLFGRTL
jgi:molybdenum cofactor cytidylyltransferase